MNVYSKDVPLTSLIGKPVNTADEELIGTSRDLLINSAGTISAVLVDIGGIFGVGNRTVAVPFADCAIVEQNGTASIVLPHLHSGEIIVAPEYRIPGGSQLKRFTLQASALGSVAVTRAGELSEQAVNKAAELGQRAVYKAAEVARNAANSKTGPYNPDPGPQDPSTGPDPHNPVPSVPTQNPSTPATKSLKVT